MNSFRAPFYLDNKRWFVTCAYNPRFRAIWLHTTPIYGIEYNSPIRCEVSWIDNICRITQRPIHEEVNITADKTPFGILNLCVYHIENRGAQHLADALQHNMVT
ncbi:unnamed protein product [Adineta steineri]|uniref:Uncharacterized protein n=1 Tax=Adineta steineri TaxID=433720 RepID=A0A814P8L6_9BILA|nr:unnamed protein product [Adineta steineri]CAF1115703.1 unnamed protein product [Adineta steineri]